MKMRVTLNKENEELENEVVSLNISQDDFKELSDYLGKRAEGIENLRKKLLNIKDLEGKEHSFNLEQIMKISFLN